MRPRKTKGDYSALQHALEETVRKHIPATNIGIAFSAGLDSGILAFLIRKYTKKAALLTVGVKGSSDFGRAEAIAKKWKMKLVKKVLNETEIATKYTLAQTVLKTNDHLQCTIGVVNLAIAELAKKKKIKTVFVGSGADELFCGYAVFDAVREDTRACEKLRTKKMKNVDSHDVQREKKCAAHYGITLEAPYLNPAFAKEARRIPAIDNLRGKYGPLRKNALRMIGENMGVPLEIVRAPKKAMQYGSGVAKITERIRKT